MSNANANTSAGKSTPNPNVAQPAAVSPLCAMETRWAIAFQTA